jgi:hypothetical protein
MRHDWIFDVLADLRHYAELHGLPATARAAGDALAVARDETGRQAPPLVPVPERRLRQG